jgi:DNA-binding protein H-NS
MPKSNLSSMSVNALLKLREDINKTLDRKVHELRSQLSLLGEASVSQQQASSLKGKKVQPKYRSPSGDTWAGRGAKPRWLVTALKKGKKVEDFLIKRLRSVRVETYGLTNSPAGQRLNYEDHCNHGRTRRTICMDQ